jgi:hypothetical protein
VSASPFAGLALILFLAACRGASGPPTIALDPPDGGDAAKASIVVRGVDASLLSSLAGERTREQWSEVLRVAVGDGQPAMLGDYAVLSDGIRFTPMFPLDRGRPYHVRFAPANLTAVVGLPPADVQPATVVAQVYPTSDVVPENQLRLYIHFSAPMGIRGGLDYVRLLDARGETVVDPFLPLDTEFWNDDHTRYTVFFDPGRQKRGITPNQQMGRSLVPGERYTLVVDREWRDANGLPLKESYRREFRVGPADERPLETSSWRLVPPAAGTRDPLVVTFPESLDHGLLLRALGVEADGRMLTGEMSIDDAETSWRFTPHEPWNGAKHQLVALGMLEDLAGNRIGRAFEVDRFDRADSTSEVERVAVPFDLRPAAGPR